MECVCSKEFLEEEYKDRYIHKSLKKENSTHKRGRLEREKSAKEYGKVTGYVMLCVSFKLVLNTLCECHQ